jgi:MFS family permease
MRLTRGASYRWAVLAMAFLSTFAAIGFGRFGYSAILPSMQKALGLSGAAAGSLASWNLAGYTSMALVGGFLAARFGARIIITIGILITAGAMVLTGLSGGLAAASAARLLTGMGNGMVLAPAIALMAAWFEPRRLGLASTIVSSGAGLGLIVVGPSAPRIIEWGGAEGWRWAWFFFAAFATLIAVLAAFTLRSRPRSAAWTATAARESVFRGFRGVVRSRYAWHLGFIYLVYGFAFMTYLTFFQKRLVSDLGYSSAAAGNIFLLVGISCLVFGLIYGLASDRFGRGRAMAATLILEAVSAVIFGLHSGTALLIVAAVIFGSGAFTMPGLMGAACGERFGAKLASPSLGFVTLFIGVGQALGPFVSGLLADATSSYSAPYLMVAGVFAVGATASLFLRGPRADGGACVLTADPGNQQP